VHRFLAKKKGKSPEGDLGLQLTTLSFSKDIKITQEFLKSNSS